MLCKIGLDTVRVRAVFNGVKVAGLIAGECLPEIHILPQREYDGSAAYRSGRASKLQIFSVHRRQRVSAPERPATDTKDIEPVRVIIAHPGRHEIRLPARRRYGKTIQCSQCGLQARLPIQTGSSFGVGLLDRQELLPVEQKLGVGLQRYRLDRLTMTVDRISVYALQKSPLAPFDNAIRCSPECRCKLSLKSETLNFQRNECCLNTGNGQTQWRCQLFGSHRPKALEATTHDFASRFFFLPLSLSQRCWQALGKLQLTKQRPETAEVFRGNPYVHIRGGNTVQAAALHQGLSKSLVVLLLKLLCADKTGGEQGIV